MSDSIRDRSANEFKRLKETGGERASRIRDIVKQAVSETVAEVRGGSQDIRQIIQEAMSTSTKTAPLSSTAAAEQDVAQSPVVVVPETVQTSTSDGEGVPMADSPIMRSEASSSDRTQESASPVWQSLMSRLVTWMKGTPLASLQRYYQEMKPRLDAFDHQMTERYGDRYQAVKDQMNRAQDWYAATKAKVEAGEESPGETFQNALDSNAQAVGTSVAQVEILIKKRLQALWASR